MLNSSNDYNHFQTYINENDCYVCNGFPNLLERITWDMYWNRWKNLWPFPAHGFPDFVIVFIVKSHVFLTKSEPQMAQNIKVEIVYSANCKNKRMTLTSTVLLFASKNIFAAIFVLKKLWLYLRHPSWLWSIYSRKRLENPFFAKRSTISWQSDCHFLLNGILNFNSVAIISTRQETFITRQGKVMLVASAVMRNK